MFAPGELLLGKYRIERELGRGGMGVVLAAHHVELDEPVAIKMVLPEHAQNAELVRRFTQEARAAAKIKSEHVVRVRDVGRLPSGEPYMVMELLDGEDLEHALNARGPLPISEAVDCMLEALEAVADAHAAGIVHRDLKPANLFLARRRDGGTCLKVLDFGISKLTIGSGSEPNAAQTQGILGSPLYMSPEQLTSSKDVDPRADVWACGVILYQLLTGALPFNGETLPQVIGSVLGPSEPTPPESLRADLPPALGDAIRLCLVKSREGRLANVAMLAQAIAPFGGPNAGASLAKINAVLAGTSGGPASISGLALAGRSTPAVSAPSTLAGMDSTDGRAERGRRRRGPVFALLGLVAVGLVGAAALLANGSRRAEREEARPHPPAATASASATAAPTTKADPESPANPASSASIEPAAASAAPSAWASVGPVGAGKSPTKPKGSTAATKASTTNSTVSCDPPYTIDAVGHRVPKPACL
jgi:hypothetical protein